MKRIGSFGVLAFLVGALFNVTFGQGDSPTAISLQSYISGLTFTVFVTNAGDGSNRMFIIQKAGTVLVVPSGSSTPNATPFLNITSRVSSAANERGLLGLAFHPDYRNNGRFFCLLHQNQRLLRYRSPSITLTRYRNVGRFCE